MVLIAVPVRVGELIRITSGTRMVVVNAGPEEAETDQTASAPKVGASLSDILPPTLYAVSAPGATGLLATRMMP